MLGPYRIEEMLGYGASAIVYRGTRASDGEVIALKIFRADLSSDTLFKKRFDHEVRAAREVEHRHLVPVIDFGEEQGRLYLAMPYGGIFPQRPAGARSVGPSPSRRRSGSSCTQRPVSTRFIATSSSTATSSRRTS